MVKVSVKHFRLQKKEDELNQLLRKVRMCIVDTPFFLTERCCVGLVLYYCNVAEHRSQVREQKKKLQKRNQSSSVASSSSSEASHTWLCPSALRVVAPHAASLNVVSALLMCSLSALWRHTHSCVHLLYLSSCHTLLP